MATKKQRLRRKTDSGYDIIHLETSADLVDGFDAAADARVADKVFASGSATKGVYIGSNGKVAAMTYSVNKDVPADAKFTDTLSTPGSAAPTMDGTAMVGTSVKYAREDHVHPTDTSRASADVVAEHGERITTLESETKLLSELVEGVDAPIYRTASGNPATFADAKAANAKELSVKITPPQEGEGDPYPPGVKNLLEMDGSYAAEFTYSLKDTVNNAVACTHNQSGGEFFAKFLAHIPRAGTYVLSWNLGTLTRAGIQIFFYSDELFGNSSGASPANINLNMAGNSAAVTFDAPGVWVVGAYISDQQNVPLRLSNLQLEAGETASNFAPYSNIRPISGVTSVSVTRTGKNLFALDSSAFELSRNFQSDRILYALNNSGLAVTVSSQPGYANAIYFSPYQPNTLAGFYASGGVSDSGAPRLRIDYANAYGSWAANAYVGAAPVRIANYPMFRLALEFNTSTAAGDYTYYPMIAEDAEQSFEACQRQSVTVPLVDSNSDPLTVYGGTLNVTTGELSVTHTLISLTGAETTGVVGDKGNTITVTHGAAYVGPDTAYMATPDIVCSHYPAVARRTLIDTANLVGACLFGSRSEKFIFSSAARVTPAEFSRFLSEQYDAGTPVQIAVPLKTPVTYQLTAAQLATLSGYNSVSVSNGTVSVTYSSDIGLAYDDLRKTFTNTILSLGAGI